MRRVPIEMRAWILGALCLLAAGVAGWLGANYIPRLPQHEGYFMVDVVDPVRVAAPAAVERVTLVVVDGLREEAARSMGTVAQLRRAGQCRTTDVGTYTVSRPIYALLSTGLEVDRSGARNNDNSAPLGAESVWDVAADAGLSVGVSSQLPWWRELFPAAFSRSVVVAKDEDVFAAAAKLDTDVTVIHPVYVDTAGHAAGAASREYAATVERVDGEALAWLATVDLERELVVFTADHGHVDAGGHGAAQPEVHNVLVCFAGPKIARTSDAAPIDSRIVGPAVAVALGLRFPKNMRAVEDGLDALWTVFAGLDAGYAEDRQRSIEVFRTANAAALAGWLDDGQPPTWTALYEQARRGRYWSIALPLALLAAAVGFALRIGGLGGRQAARSMLWIMLTLVATGVVWVALRGSFDYTSINERTPFIRNSLLICGGVAVAAAWLHIRVFADPARWAADQATLTLVVVGLSIAHVFAFGWPLGFPVPHRFVLFFPFLAATFGVVHGGLGGLAALRWARSQPD